MCKFDQRQKKIKKKLTELRKRKRRTIYCRTLDSCKPDKTKKYRTKENTIRLFVTIVLDCVTKKNANKHQKGERNRTQTQGGKRIYKLRRHHYIRTQTASLYTNPNDLVFLRRKKRFI